VGTFAVVMSPARLPFVTGLGDFEAGLLERFSDARVVERGASTANALAWSRGDYGSPRWMGGSISEDCVAVYLKGEHALIYETAIWLATLRMDATLTWDWQGIVFDLSRIASPHELAAAVESDDQALAWRDDSGRDIQQP
jgi:hypothetical protein